MASSTSQTIPSDAQALTSAALGNLEPMTYEQARTAAGDRLVVNPLKPSEMLDTASRPAICPLAQRYREIANSPKELIKDMERLVSRWLFKSIGARVIVKSEINYANLKKAASSGISAEAHQYLVPSFPTILSKERPTIVYDDSDRILVYKYRLHNPEGSLIEQLVDSTAQLPARKPNSGPCGIFTTRHYGVWCNSAPSPFVTADNVYEASDDNSEPGSTQWLQRNKALFNRLSKDVRMICPKFHAAHQALRRILPANVHPPAGLFQVVVVNQGQDDALEGTVTHNDWKDHRKDFNCVLPFGNYQGGELILWQLGLAFDLRPGDVILFRRHQISHNTKPTTGTRNAIDLFDHDNVFKWARDVFNGKKKGGSQAEEVGYGQHPIAGPQYW